jgi:cytochrome c553
MISMIRLHMFGLLLATAFFATASTSAHAAGDKAAGRKLIYTCAGCHGVPGYTNAYPQYPVPKIAGQNQQYIINALHGYKSGDRKHPTMNAQAESLSDTDIDNIAAYLSSLAPAMPTMADADRKKLDDHLTEVAKNSPGGSVATTCFACHGQDGNSVDPQYPRLAGQYNLYLQQVLKEYKDGQRNNAIMKGMVATLSDKDIENIAEYFATLPSQSQLPIELDTLKGHIQGDK